MYSTIAVFRPDKRLDKKLRWESYDYINNPVMISRLYVTRWDNAVELVPAKVERRRAHWEQRDQRGIDLSLSLVAMLIA